jgi:hypothetical protein
MPSNRQQCSAPHPAMLQRPLCIAIYLSFVSLVLYTPAKRQAATQHQTRYAAAGSTLKLPPTLLAAAWISPPRPHTAGSLGLRQALAHMMKWRDVADRTVEQRMPCSQTHSPLCYMHPRCCLHASWQFAMLTSQDVTSHAGCTRICRRAASSQLCQAAIVRLCRTHSSQRACFANCTAIGLAASAAVRMCSTPPDPG